MSNTVDTIKEEYNVANSKKDAVFVIGNGFDMAHELNTDYWSFANWLYTDVILKELEECHDHGKAGDLLQSIYEGNQKLSFFYKADGKALSLKKVIDSNHLIILLNYNQLGFLSTLYEGGAADWNQVESIYFREICYLIEKANSQEGDSQEILCRLIEGLDRQFDIIKRYLQRYLKTKQIPARETISNFTSILNNLTKEYETLTVVNFNYTDSFSRYKPNILHITSENIRQINVHGVLNEENDAPSNIVFGFGNEDDPEYKKIKGRDLRKVYTNFKTFEYVKRAQYSQVLGAMAGRDESIDIHVFGHSLSMCDKTLLKTMFTSPSCHKIQLYKRTDLDEESQIEDFMEKVFNIDMIVESESTVRSKVVNLEVSTEFGKKT